MKTVVPILILVLLVSYSVAEKPGLSFALKQPLLEKARDKYFTTLFTKFGHQTVPDVSEKHLKIYNINVRLANASPKNLKVGFNEVKNAMTVEVDHTQIEVSVNYKYKKSILSIKGDGKITGDIKSIGLGISFEQIQKDGMYVPQLKIKDFNFNISKSDMKLKIHCKHCPGEIEKLISSTLKGKLIDSVKKQINSQVPSQLESVGNSLLKSSYPTTTTLYDNIDIATGLTGLIKVSADHLEVPLDATIFPHSQGYKRQGGATDMPAYNAKDPGVALLFLNPYLLSTLSNTINQGIQKYKATLIGIQYDILLDPKFGKTSLALEEGDFSVTFNPTITATDYGLGVHLGASAKLNPKILNGDSKNMFSVTPSLKGLNLTKFVVFQGDNQYDLTFAVDYLNLIIQGMLNIFVIPTINIPKQDIFPLHVTNSELDFHKQYAEFGVIFDLSRD